MTPPQDEISLQVPKVAFSRDVVYCHPYLRERWPKVLFLFREATGHDLILTCTYRSPAEQQRLWRQGRLDPGPVVTNCDGINVLSEHNKFLPNGVRAMDVAVDIEPSESKQVITWQAENYYPLGPICRKLNIVWGGAWERLKDYPHMQCPKGVV